MSVGLICFDIFKIKFADDTVRSGPVAGDEESIKL